MTLSISELEKMSSALEAEHNVNAEKIGKLKQRREELITKYISPIDKEIEELQDKNEMLYNASNEINKLIGDQK